MTKTNTGFQAVLIGLFLAVGGSWAQQPKLIEFGRMPHPTYVRDNIRAMEQVPFDGIAMDLHGEGISQGIFRANGWGSRKLDWVIFAESIAAIRETEFRSFTDNFLVWLAYPGDVDWFAPEFEAVIHNFQLMAMLARELGFKGIFMDLEPYTLTNPFNYRGGGLCDTRRSLREYQQQVRLRGRQMMAAANEVYPGITIMTTFANSMCEWDWTGPTPEDFRFNLIPPFFDGLLEGADAETRIFDGWERAYSQRKPEEFHQMALATPNFKGHSQVPDLYARRMLSSYGIWLDRQGNEYNPATPQSNYFTPAVWEQVLRAALAASGGYVWLYSEHLDWFTGHNINQEYLDAMARAKR